MNLLHKATNHPLFQIACFAVLALSFSNCELDEEQQLENRSWTLVWSDEFEGAAGQAPDPNNWAYDIGTGINGWGNQETQYYTDRPENVSLDGNGNLVITALRETFGGASYTSGRINTKNLFNQSYGRFEARMITPYGPGLWPAFWLLGSNIDEVEWPQCGEIDVMELRGQQPNMIAGSIHGPGYSAGDAITASYTSPDSRFDEGYHVYAIEWQKGQIDFFVDDFLYQTITPDDVDGEWVFDDSPFYMLLNVAIGGEYVGFAIPQTIFPQRLIVDWVKVFEKS
ncbi:MAG: glycoside hydrolase family 16 protein [Bacteroidota bacterium]